MLPISMVSLSCCAVATNESKYRTLKNVQRIIWCCLERLREVVLKTAVDTTTAVGNLGPLYTMGHGRWPFFMVWLLKRSIYKAFGSLTRCKLNVECAYVFNVCLKGWLDHSLVLSCHHLPTNTKGGSYEHLQWTQLSCVSMDHVQMTSSLINVSNHVKGRTSLLVNIQVVLELIIDVELGPAFFLGAI
jgi:hypothetical protein